MQARKLLDKSLALLAFPASHAVIEKLVCCALDLVKPVPDSGYADAGDEAQETEFFLGIPVFSSLFWDTLLDKSSRLWSCYTHWPSPTRARLWTVEDALMKAELEDVLLELCEGTAYRSPSQLQDALRQTPLAQTLAECPWAFRTLLGTLAQLTLAHHDWRMIRVGQALHDLLSQDPVLLRFPGVLHTAARLLRDVSGDPKEVQAKLAEHVYADSVERMDAHRIEAWWLTLLYPDFVHRCALHLMEWVAVSTMDWDIKVSQRRVLPMRSHVRPQLETCCRYLVWMTCPSDDERTHMAYEDMVDWLKWLRRVWAEQGPAQVANGFGWCQSVCNGHMVVAQAFLVAALTCAPEWTEEDWKALVNTSQIRMKRRLTQMIRRMQSCKGRRDVLTLPSHIMCWITSMP